jgi:hypothetical protein
MRPRVGPRRPKDTAAARDRRRAVGPCGLRGEKRGQRFGGDDPARYSGAEVLGEKRSQRLRFPALDVARRPIVEQAQADDVLARARDRDRFAEGIARPNPGAELKFKVEPGAWPEAGHGVLAEQPLAIRPAYRRAGGKHAGSAAVIGNRHVLVIRCQRRIRAAAAPGVGGVMDTGEEIRKRADRCRQMHRARGRIMQQFRRELFNPRALSAVRREQQRHAFAQGAARRGAAPSASSGLSVAPAAARAANSAVPENSPASNAACRSKILSPIAIPPRGAPPSTLNIPSGRFWIGNSLCPCAEAIQLARFGS